MLKDAIYKRTSIRKYKDEPLSDEVLNKIRQIIKEQKSLFQGMKYKIDLVLEGKAFHKILGGIIGSYGKVHAPHYLVASVKPSDNAYENIAYMLEYIVLKLTEMNIGTCWIGGGIKKNLFKDFLQLDNELNPIVVIAFGNPLNKSFSNNKVFKRKALTEIAKGHLSEDYKKVMEYVRLAPSAVNLQPWRYFISENSIDIYRVNNNFLLKSHFEDLNKIDLGISICHFEIGMNELNKKLVLKDLAKSKDKHIYFKSHCIE